MKKLYLLSLTTVFLWMLSHLPVAAQPAPIMPGDINCDRVIDVSDVDVIIDNILGRQELEGKGFINADLTHDGIIDVADVNALIDLILGKGYVHADPRSLVVALRDGTVHSFPLADKPEVSFVDDELLVKSEMETSYFGRNQLYQVYYTMTGGGSHARRLQEPVADNPNQYAVYIYRNDDDFNAHLNIDIESIRFSAVGMDSIWYDNAVVQEIWTPDSVYRTPLAVVDSLTFQAPSPIYKGNVFHIRNYHTPYIMSAEGLSLTLSRGISSDSIPHVGQIVISDQIDERLPRGFSGRVISVETKSDSYVITCEAVALTDIFERLVLVGRSESYTPEDMLRIRKKSSASGGGGGGSWGEGDDWDGVVPFELGKFSLNIPSIEGVISNSKSDMTLGTLSITPKFCVSYIADIRPFVRSHVKVLFENKSKVSTEMHLKVSGESSLTETKKARIYITKVPIPLVAGVLYGEVAVSGDVYLKGNVDLKATFSKNIYNGDEYEWSTSDFWTIYHRRYDKDPKKANKGDDDDNQWQSDVSLSVNGSFGFGASLDLVLFAVSENTLEISNTTTVGPELSGSLQFSSEGLKDGTLYSTLKNTNVTFTPLKLSDDVKFNICMREFTLGSFSKDFGKKEFKLFPDFDQLSLPTSREYNRGDYNPLGLYTKVTNDVIPIIPLKLGIGRYDQDGNLIDECFASNFYQYEDEWDRRWLTYDISSLPAGDTYSFHPLIRMWGLRALQLKAMPKSDLLVPEPMSLETNQVTIQKGKAANVAINGGWGEYTIFNLNKDACTAELKKDGNAHYIQIVGKTEGTSSTVTVKDARTGDTKVILVTVSEQADKQTFTVNGVSFTMVNVKGGTFTMGATDEQGEDPDSDEFPPHQVTLSNYSIGETEVTQELWRAVMGSNPSNFNGDNLPVDCVSWDDCQTFITKLNQLTGGNFRLPTEAEWEYAARGGEKTKNYKYAGSNTIGNVAWYKDNSNNETHPVGMKAPNELGLYDMCGNVWEWCQDWYGDYSDGAQTNPTGPSSGTLRVNRGGSFNRLAVYTRLSKRGNLYSDYYRKDLGLRLAM